MEEVENLFNITYVCATGHKTVFEMPREYINNNHSYGIHDCPGKCGEQVNLHKDNNSIIAEPCKDQESLRFRGMNYN